ncbi:LURP-one-related/scramblase family protein [Spirillospora sp. NPDC127200]
MRFKVRERIVGIGNDSWIEDESGERAFLVDGKVLGVRQTFELKDPGGAVLAVIRRKMLGVHNAMTVERDGRQAAVVRKHLINLPRDRFTVELAGGGEWAVSGNVLHKQYTVEGEAGRIAVIARKWVRVRDAYEVEIPDDTPDVPLVLAVAVAVDTLAEGKGG